MSQQDQCTTFGSSPQSTSSIDHVNTTARSQTEGQYVNVTLDVLESGILPVLTGRLREVLLIFAGIALMDTRSQRYRTCYVNHRWLGEKLGVKRQTATGYVNDLVRLFVIKRIGRHKPSLARKGQQPFIRYAIVDFEELTKQASRLVQRDKKSFDQKALDRVDKSREGVETVRHLVDERVSNGSDTYMSNGSDTYPQRVSNGSDTKRYVDLVEMDVGKGSKFSFNGNGDNFEEETADLDDAEIEEQKMEVRHRLFSILEAAQLSEDKRSVIIRTINEEAERGETRADKHRLAVEAVDQLEFEFGRIDEQVDTSIEDH